MESFKSVVYTLRDRYLPYHEGRLRWQQETSGLYLATIFSFPSFSDYFPNPPFLFPSLRSICVLRSRLFTFFYVSDYNLELPPWLCQPYVRHLPEECVRKLETGKLETVSIFSLQNRHGRHYRFYIFYHHTAERRNDQEEIQRRRWKRNIAKTFKEA